MFKRLKQSRALFFLFAMLVLFLPNITLADTAATGSITGVSPFNMSFNETMTLNDGTTSYVFVFQNGAGGFNGQCVDNTFNHYAQPCVNGDKTVIDTGGGPTEANMVTRITNAINGTAIGITASESGTTINLVNDTPGTAGNQTITETVSNNAFIVTGMSGGTGGGGGGGGTTVSEFSDMILLLTLSTEILYAYNKSKKEETPTY